MHFHSLQSSDSSDSNGQLSPLPRKGSSKVEPVLTRLPSWPVIAEVLSFAGYEQEIDDLLKKLSRNSNHYLARDKPILKAFTVAWTPDLERIIDIGNRSCEWTHSEEISETCAGRRL